MLAELFSGRALRPVSVAGAAPSGPAPALPSVAQEVSHPEAMAPVSVAAEAPAEETEEEAEAARVAADHDFSIEAVAAHLLDHGIRVAVSVSPGGDEGSTAAVMLARLLAEEEQKVVLIDLSGSACPTRLMAQSPHLPGITNLLSGEVAFTESIHADRFSEAHVIPHGDADPLTAMRGIERLQMIIDALTNAYDLVLIECGAADAAAVAKVARREGIEIILSAPSVSEEWIVEELTRFGEAGYRDIVLMTGGGQNGPDFPDRWAA
ncbi:MAG TPA: tyrosine-protein kinase family protein, partial [Sinorhizobium sp.]|nr:tyrosine-protein kinase family protein [Sinorhizobium sp.]